MKTFIKPHDLNVSRFTFIETLSDEFLAMTGHGVYAYLTPVDIDLLFTSYAGLSMPIRAFARQCVKNILN